MYGKYGMTSEFDSYGINAFQLWYDAEDGMMMCWMNGETHSYVDLDSDGNYVCYEPDYGQGPGYPQPLGPSVPYLQGPRPFEDVIDSCGYAFAGINHSPA